MPNRDPVKEREYQREYRKRNRERLSAQKRTWWKSQGAHWNRDHHRKQRYGISSADYEYLLALHNGACWMCDKPFTMLNGPQVDHDHVLGGEAGNPDKERLRRSVRGLLDNRCNHLVDAVEQNTWTGQKGSGYAELLAVGRYLARPYPFQESA